MNDARFITRETIDAYIEMTFAIMSVRFPPLHSHLLSLLPGVQISSSYQINGKAQDLCIPTPSMIDGFRKDGHESPKLLRASFTQVNSMFIVAMWAALVEMDQFKEISKEPDVQFFRHVRNGCAHGNYLNFKNLHFKAKWRDKTIGPEHRETPVFPDLLKDGDPILMITDINNLYFTTTELPGFITYLEHS